MYDEQFLVIEFPCAYCCVHEHVSVPMWIWEINHNERILRLLNAITSKEYKEQWLKQNKHSDSILMNDEQFLIIDFWYYNGDDIHERYCSFLWESAIIIEEKGFFEV